MPFRFILVLKAVIAELTGVLLFHFMGTKVIRIVKLLGLLGTAVTDK